MAQTRIMVVEDEMAVALDISASLKEAGYVVTSVSSSGEKAIVRAEEERPDMVLMDIVLHGRMDGIEAAECIRGRLGIPVIFLTAYADDEWLARAKLTEPFGYLVKPFHIRELKAAIETALYKAEREKKLEESEERYRRVVELCPDIISIHSNGHCVFVNRAGEEFDAAPPGQNPMAKEPPESAAEGKPLGLNVQKAVRPDGSFRMIELASRPFTYQDRPAVLSIGRDITRRQEAEKGLLATQNRLRSLAAQLSLEQEQEKRRITAGLIEGVVQTLSLSTILLTKLETSAPSPDRAKALHEVVRHIQRAIADTKALTLGISSPELFELGLEAALDELAYQTETRRQIRTSLEDDEQPKPMSENVRVALYQACRELVDNAVKHARASAIKIAIRREDDRVVVEVGDDGRGFDLSQLEAGPDQTGPLGLFGVREILGHLGGETRIESRPGQGTLVTLTAPLDKE